MIRALTMGLLLSASVAPAFAAEAPKSQAKDTQSSTGRPHRVFELRTYYIHEGKVDDLHMRFREHTNRLFQKHGFDLVGYWTPRNEKAGNKEKLVYLIAFPNREAATASWKAFAADPEWQKVWAESEKNGTLVDRIESVFLDPTDYSPIK